MRIRFALCEADYYATSGVELRTSEAVIEIDRNSQEVVTEQGRYPYDRLVLATGSFPFVPPIPGNDRDSCLVYLHLGRPRRHSGRRRKTPPPAWWLAEVCWALKRPMPCGG